MLLLYILLGTVLAIVTTALSFIGSVHNVATTLRFIFRLFPNYCFSEIIISEQERTTPTVFPDSPGLWSLEITGYPMIYMAIEAVFWFAIVMLIEKVATARHFLS